MLPISTPSRPVRRLRIQIREILAVVVGYGMAAALLPGILAGRRPARLVDRAGDGTLRVAGPGGSSGPILLLRRELRDRAAAEAGISSAPAPGAGSRTWAEWAWLFVGSYWIVLGLFVIPARLHSFGPGDALLFGLAPILAAVGFRLVGPTAAAAVPNPGWTHPAAVWLLLTWPVAWACLVAVGRGLLKCGAGRRHVSARALSPDRWPFPSALASSGGTQSAATPACRRRPQAIQLSSCWRSACPPRKRR